MLDLALHVLVMMNKVILFLLFQNFKIAIVDLMQKHNAFIDVNNLQTDSSSGLPNLSFINRFIFFSKMSASVRLDVSIGLRNMYVKHLALDS